MVLWVLEVDLGRYILFFQVLALFAYPNPTDYAYISYDLQIKKITILTFANMMQIRSIEMLHKRFESFPEAFAKNLSPQRFLALFSEFVILIVYD